jgi:hypothetical protein
MTLPMNPARRSLLQRLALGLSLVPLAMPRSPAAAPDPAGGAPALVSESDPAATKVHYVEDARRANGASAGATCESCSLYSGPSGADRGSCTLFPGKLVRAAGWCNAWSSL